MILNQFNGIYNDIAKSLDDGEPMHLWCGLANGASYHGFFFGELLDFGIVMLQLDDQPPLYIAVEAIVALGPWSGVRYAT